MPFPLNKKNASATQADRICRGAIDNPDNANPQATCVVEQATTVANGLPLNSASTSPVMF